MLLTYVEDYVKLPVADDGDGRRSRERCLQPAATSRRQDNEEPITRVPDRFPDGYGKPISAMVISRAVIRPPDYYTFFTERQTFCLLRRLMI